MFGAGRFSVGDSLVKVESPIRTGARTPAHGIRSIDMTSNASSHRFNADLMNEAMPASSEMGDTKKSHDDLMDVYKQLTRSLVQGRVTFGQKQGEKTDEKTRIQNQSQ